MSKRRKTPTKITAADVTGRVPRGAWYIAQKGMAYSPTTRDANRKQRKQARQDIRRGEW